MLTITENKCRGGKYFQRQQFTFYLLSSLTCGKRVKAKALDRTTREIPRNICGKYNKNLIDEMQCNETKALTLGEFFPKKDFMCQ